VTAFSLIVVMTLTGAFASFFFKKTADSRHFRQIVSSPFLYAGGFLYLFSALLNIEALRNLPYSIVLPLTSVTYIWTLFVSHFFLGEQITLKKVAGVMLILTGSLCISFAI
jgi:drug/metabolite transporter (DMT)-like permease